MMVNPQEKPNGYLINPFKKDRVVISPIQLPGRCRILKSSFFRLFCSFVPLKKKPQSAEMSEWTVMVVRRLFAKNVNCSAFSYLDNLSPFT